MCDEEIGGTGSYESSFRVTRRGQVGDEEIGGAVVMSVV